LSEAILSSIRLHDVASHDLKEPLRGNHNYSIFIEDYGGSALPLLVYKLATLVRLTQRMEDPDQFRFYIIHSWGALKLSRQPQNLA